MRDTNSYRITTNSTFGPTVEWESLPTVGEDRDRRFRARFWRLTLMALATFWLAVIAGIARWAS